MTVLKSHIHSTSTSLRSKLALASFPGPSLVTKTGEDAESEAKEQNSKVGVATGV